MSLLPTRLLIANRGEIALRILRTAADLDLETVAVHSADDADLPHVRAATRSVALSGVGPAAYLDQPALLAAIENTAADLVHPGYGFLAENADFARACGSRFVGPTAEHLDLLGDKSAARRAAQAAEVPVLPATDGPSTAEQMRALLAAQPGGIMVKALAGGGGRGMREVRTEAELDDAVTRCTAEALAAFGNGDLFAEALLPRARHVEVLSRQAGSPAALAGCRLARSGARYARRVTVTSPNTLVNARVWPDSPRLRATPSVSVPASRRSSRPDRTSRWVLQQPPHQLPPPLSSSASSSACSIAVASAPARKSTTDSNVSRPGDEPVAVPGRRRSPALPPPAPGALPLDQRRAAGLAGRRNSVSAAR